MVDVWLTIRPVLVQCLHHLLIQSDDHDVRPYVEFISASHRMRLVRYPLATVHIGNSYSLIIGRTTGHAVFEELQKDLVETTRLIVSALRNTRKAGPRCGASPENAELAAGRRRPVEHGCILR